MSEECFVLVPDVQKMKSSFKDVFNRSLFNKFAAKSQEIIRKIEKHKKLAEKIQKQQEFYSRANCTLEASEFRLKLAKNDLDHLESTCTSVLQSQTDEMLKKIHARQKRVVKNNQESTKEFRKLQKLMTKENVLRSGLKMLEHDLMVELSRHVLQIEAESVMDRYPSQHGEKLSVEDVVKKISLKIILPVPKSLSSMEEIIAREVEVDL